MDLVIYDGVGQPYDGGTRSGIGGSEHFVIKLARGLAARGVSVLVRNTRVGPPMEVDGVRYESNQTAQEVECKTLLLQRATPLPHTVGFDHLVVQAHDVYSSAYDGLHMFLERLNGVVVCNSQWQANRFPFKPVIIPPMLHELPAPRTKDPHYFIYASAALKGFDATLNKWRTFRKRHPELRDARLGVISSGYDEPRRVDDPSIIYLGSLADDQLLEHLNFAAGMFYVNMFEETFGVTAALAECLGTRTHILCPNGFGALYETLSDHQFLTNDALIFYNQFVANYGTAVRQQSTRDYRPATTLNRWLTVLHLDK